MPRFADISDADLQQIIKEKDAKNTQKATVVAWNAFNNYLKEKNIVINPENVVKSDLESILIKFYVELRKQDGSLYAKTAFRSIRHGLQRKFKALQNIDIINDSEFVKSDAAFTAQCVQMKKQGLSKVQHKPPISKDDLMKLYSSCVFSVEKPKSLLRKVFFELFFFLCRRGQENLRALTKSCFIIKTDENGVEYVMKNIDEYDKNHRENDADSEGGIIYSTGKENCPVKSFKLYLEKLNPKVDALFQRPKPETPISGPWYDGQVLGVKSLEKMMKQISQDAGLSVVYTNHSIRATCITLLDNAGNEARHIMAISSHKSESSIRSYSKTGLGNKRKMSSLLSSMMTSIPENKSNADDLEIDDRSFLDSVQFSSSYIDCGCCSSSDTERNAKYHNSLKEFSMARNFNFNMDLDLDEDTSFEPKIKSNQPTNQMLLSTSTPTRQVSNINQNNNASSMNKFFSMFGNNPVFNNCTFKIGN